MNIILYMIKIKHEQDARVIEIKYRK